MRLTVIGFTDNLPVLTIEETAEAFAPSLIDDLTPDLGTEINWFIAIKSVHLVLNSLNVQEIRTRREFYYTRRAWKLERRKDEKRRQK